MAMANLTAVYFSLRWFAVIASTFLGLMMVTFVIGRLMPLDPVLLVVGHDASAEQYKTAYLAMGLDKPVIVQFLVYLGHVLMGDFGRSIMTSQPVIDDILRVVPATIELATVGTLIGVTLGVPLGMLAAVNHGTWIDGVVRVISLIGYSIPVFWKGIMLLLVIYATLGWTAGPGRIDVYYDGVVETRTGFLLIDSALQGEWEIFRNVADHLILPAISLGYASGAYITRMTRSFMLEQLRQEYVTAARAKGLSERKIIFKHVFRNTAIQLITVIALTYGLLLEGSVLTETVFAWPGLGQYLTLALFNADMNAVLGSTVVIGVVFIALNLGSDVLYRILEPRARV
jgi:peptide/nickel transport system permease protein